MRLLKRFPIRLKIMVVLLAGITLVVSLITFTMANFFHADKKAYVNDWVSIAALTTAAECDDLLTGYARRLRSYARVLEDPDVPGEKKTELLRGFFEDFPQLVDLTIYHGEEPIESATDHVALENAGLSVADLEAYRAEHPLPLERIAAGEIHLRNSTLSKDLPTLTMSFEPGTADVDESRVLSGTIHLEELLRLGARFKVFEVSLADADGILLVHPNLSRVVARAPANLGPQAHLVHEENRAGMTLEFTREGREMIGGFASVPFGGITVSAQVVKSAAYLASRDLLVRSMWVSLILLAAFGIGSRILAKRITGPMERLSLATREVAQGLFDVRVEVDSRDEIGDLAGSFNQMTNELHGREEQLAAAHTQLIQSEKLAAFGQLGAGIAHEVKNPLTGISGCAQLALLEAKDGTRMRKNIEIIKKESDRCRQIIENLLKFARQERTLLEPTNVNAVVEDSATIVNHQMEVNDVKLTVDLAEDLPAVHANPNQLQQVLMNLMINAQQAMGDEEGEIILATRETDAGEIEIVVQDTGPGIPGEIQNKLFDPFFTTKPAGQGTGLGLSVSFGIVRDHGGEIVVESEPGHGATFSIRLPPLNVSETAGNTAN